MPSTTMRTRPSTTEAVSSPVALIRTHRTTTRRRITATVLASVVGCTNPFACNFDEDATADDGSCDLESCYGCINPLACNYDADATLSDGSCDLFSCRGCTNPDAVNYDADATLDDGSCIRFWAAQTRPRRTTMPTPLMTTVPASDPPGCIITIACQLRRALTPRSQGDLTPADLHWLHGIRRPTTTTRPPP